MNKADLKLLEKVFGQEIIGGVFQSNSKAIRKLEDDGFVQYIAKHKGKDRFGVIIIEGYVTTLKGNIAYCTSDLCKEIENDQN